MDCKECCDLLSDYSESRLEGETKRSLEEHIRMCSSCADAFAGIKIIAQTLRRLPRIEASTRFDFVLRGRLREEILKSERGRVLRFIEQIRGSRRWVWTLAGTSIIIAILSALLWTGETDSIRNRWASDSPEAASLERIEATNYVLERIALSELNTPFFDSSITRSDTIPERRVAKNLIVRYVTF